MFGGAEAQGTVGAQRRPEILDGDSEAPGERHFGKFQQPGYGGAGTPGRPGESAGSSGVQGAGPAGVG